MGGKCFADPLIDHSFGEQSALQFPYLMADKFGVAGQEVTAFSQGGSQLVDSGAYSVGCKVNEDVTAEDQVHILTLRAGGRLTDQVTMRRMRSSSTHSSPRRWKYRCCSAGTTIRNDN